MLFQDTRWKYFDSRKDHKDFTSDTKDFKDLLGFLREMHQARQRETEREIPPPTHRQIE